MEKFRRTEQETQPTIQAVIFDADGVVINSDRITKHLNRDFGIPLDVSLTFFNGDFQKCLVGEADVMDLLPDYLRVWGIPMKAEQFLEYWLKAEDSVDQQLLDYIENLRENGTPCFIATNQEKYRIDYMLSQMGFSQKFDGLFSSHALGSKKPSLEFYAEMFQSFNNMQANEVLFWDDTPSNVDGAQNFGLNAEQYTTFSDFEDKMKRYLP